MDALAKGSFVERYICYNADSGKSGGPLATYKWIALPKFRDFSKLAQIFRVPARKVSAFEFDKLPGL
jgi:hypothetical protein